MNDKVRKENRKYLLVSRPAPIRGRGGHGGEEKKGVGIGTALAISMITRLPRVAWVGHGNSGTCYTLIISAHNLADAFIARTSPLRRSHSDLSTMPLEATMIVLDNSEYMRNGDYQPTRFGALADAVTTVFQTKIDSNPENTVGVMTMANKGCALIIYIIKKKKNSLTHKNSTHKNNSAAQTTSLEHVSKNAKTKIF